MSESESERKATNDGDGRERGDGDGGGHKQERETRPETFVFRRADPQVPKKAVLEKESGGGTRRPVALSYKEKLLSPGGLGYLVSHAEEEDIVNGWKGFFARKNAEKETVTEDAEAVREEDMGASQMSGYPVLSVTSEQYTTWCRPWMNSLIIKLLGVSIPKHALIDRVRRMWKPKQPLKVVPLSNDYFIVSFSSIEDRDYALYEGPWMIDDHYLLVQRWRPNFNPKKADCQRRIAVWVRIPDLPMEFCTVESLGIIGGMIGRMIKIDRSTSIYDKGEFARICVEVDLQQPLLPAFTAFGEDKQLVYEGLHLVCFGCGLYGHEQASCPHRTMASGGENSELEKQSMGAEVGNNADLSKQRVAVAGVNKEGPKHTEAVADGGSGKGDIPGCGSNKMKGGFTAAAADAGPDVTHGIGGGSKHLGPQMIFTRDLRWSSNKMAKSLGMKSGITELSQGFKSDGMNHGKTRGMSNGLEQKGVNAEQIKGNSNLSLNVKDMNKPLM